MFQFSPVSHNAHHGTNQARACLLSTWPLHQISPKLPKLQETIIVIIQLNINCTYSTTCTVICCSIIQLLYT